MTMFPVGFDVVLDATRTRAQSALPNAPVRADDPVRDEPRRSLSPDHTPVRARLRTMVATALRTLATGATRAAERIEPAC